MILTEKKSARAFTLEFGTISLNAFLRVILTLLIVKKSSWVYKQIDVILCSTLASQLVGRATCRLLDSVLCTERYCQLGIDSMAIFIWWWYSEMSLNRVNVKVYGIIAHHFVSAVYKLSLASKYSKECSVVYILVSSHPHFANIHRHNYHSRQLLFFWLESAYE